MAKKQKSALVLGAGGFIGSHLVKSLKGEDFFVVGVDIKKPEYSKSKADKFIKGDLRDPVFVKKVFSQSYDEVYQLAGDMGGAGYIFTGDNDANIMHNSALININVLDAMAKSKSKKIFYSSSACIYPEYNQMNTKSPKLSEESAYPAAPDSEYGWEKIFSERLFLSYHRNFGLEVRIARFHNVFGPEGAWKGGREKAPAATCRKVAEAKPGGSIEIWGDGKQTRSFLYIDECLVGVRKLMDSDFTGPINIGSDEMVSINKLAQMVMDIAGKQLKIKHVEGPQGVRGRTSDNRLIKKKLGWAPKLPLRSGMEQTYKWIEAQVGSK
jgi:GDP-D-mannose 3',5'-epimerase